MNRIDSWIQGFGLKLGLPTTPFGFGPLTVDHGLAAGRDFSRASSFAAFAFLESIASDRS